MPNDNSIICNPFKYGLFLCIYLVLFYCLYTTNLEVNGFISIFFVNLFISFLLIPSISSDGNAEPYKKNIYVLLIILIGMICNIIASFLVAMTLIHLKIKYDTEPITYNPTNRKQLDDYKSLFVTNVLSIFLLIILIVYQNVVNSKLTEINKMVNNLFKKIKNKKSTTNDTNSIVIDTNKNTIQKVIDGIKNTVSSIYESIQDILSWLYTNLYVGFLLTTIYKFIPLFDVYAIIQYILCLLILCISVYIMVLSNSLSRASNNKIIPNTGGNTGGNTVVPKTIEPNSWRGYDIQRYFTSQYIINSKLT